jgi:hypothetical protein
MRRARLEEPAPDLIRGWMHGKCALPSFETPRCARLLRMRSESIELGRLAARGVA